MTTTNELLNSIASGIDILDSTYDRVEARYDALSAWFAKSNSQCHEFDPHIYVQGSFRLGTAIRPLDAKGELDLDMGCRLRTGITKATHTQQQLKNLVGNDIDAYRIAQGFEQPREEKNRCWRLKYSDELNFHLDIVPSIPVDDIRKGFIREAMVKNASPSSLAQSVAESAGSITDLTRADYSTISNNWLISNSEGYALWFKYRMEQSRSFFEKWGKEAHAARVDELPLNKRKSPLQKSIQLLKRHRDSMFADAPDVKPISIIITTLAALAYQGETDLSDALPCILDRMEQFVHPTFPRICNPVNPAEDFADKWDKAEYGHLELERNFRRWLAQVRVDIHNLQNNGVVNSFKKVAKSGFSVDLPDELVISSACSSNGGFAHVKEHSIPNNPARPWASF